MSATAILAREYTAALQDYLAGRDEAALRRAYEAGRRAMEEGLGVPDMVAAHQESAGKALRSEVRQRDQARVLERVLICFAASLSPFEGMLREAREANGRLQERLSSLQWIDEQLRHQNEELAAAHRSAEKERASYRALFEFAPDAYLVTGIEGAIREANSAAAAMLRAPQELLPGQSLHEFVARMDREQFRGRLLELHSGSLDHLADWEISLQPHEGPPLPAALTVAADRSVPADASLRWLIRDATERKRREKERARWLVGRAKAQAARRFEFLAEASSLLVGSVDMEASLIWLAHLTASFLGGWCFISVVDTDGTLRQVEVAHADPSVDEWTAPDPRSVELEKALRGHCLFGARGGRGALSAGPHAVEPLTAAWCDRAADSPEHSGLLRQLSGTALVLPLRIHDRLVGVMTLVSPFGARRSSRVADQALGEDLARRCALALENARLYREIVAERDKAMRASRAQEELVAILGHELRNPLTPIIGWTRILRNHALVSRDPILAEGVKAMEKNAITLTRLVSDCADLTKISEGKIQVERRLVNLNQIAMASLQAVREMAAERGLALQAELAPAPVPVLGDAMRLEQVATNLLMNAVKYTDREGIISIRTGSTGGEAELQVTDTGIGIDPMFLERIFEPFRQGTNAWLTSQSGLGLGLAIARRIVELHDGRIWAESPGLGCGSTFLVRLPMAAVAAAGSGAGTFASPPAGPGKSLRILVVEDSGDILFLMKTELEGMGHTVIAAENGEQGLEAARASAPDLIISDIRMPLMDGYELIRCVREAPLLSGIPAIALTGFQANADMERALQAGFDACVSKPAEPVEIDALIRRLTETEQHGHTRAAPVAGPPAHEGDN